MTKRHGMKKKGHFRKHWKKYAAAGAGLGGVGAALFSRGGARTLGKLATGQKLKVLGKQVTLNKAGRVAQGLQKLLRATKRPRKGIQGILGRKRPQPSGDLRQINREAQIGATNRVAVQRLSKRRKAMKGPDTSAKQASEKLYAMTDDEKLVDYLTKPQKTGRKIDPYGGRLEIGTRPDGSLYGWRRGKVGGAFTPITFKFNPKKGKSRRIVDYKRGLDRAGQKSLNRYLSKGLSRRERRRMYPKPRKKEERAIT